MGGVFKLPKTPMRVSRWAITDTLEQRTQTVLIIIIIVSIIIISSSIIGGKGSLNRLLIQGLVKSYRFCPPPSFPFTLCSAPLTRPFGGPESGQALSVGTSGGYNQVLHRPRNETVRAHSSPLFFLCHSVAVVAGWQRGGSGIDRNACVLAEGCRAECDE